MEIDIPFNATLEILVENMGRINYGSKLYITWKESSACDYQWYREAGNWQMYKFPLYVAPELSGISVKMLKAGLRFTREALPQQNGWNIPGYAKRGKGIVFVNGHHLGRYWSVGLQQTLYVPVMAEEGGKWNCDFWTTDEYLQTEVSSITTPYWKTWKPNSGSGGKRLITSWLLCIMICWVSISQAAPWAASLVLLSLKLGGTGLLAVKWYLFSELYDYLFSVAHPKFIVAVAWLV